jgi:hypothetical protein
MSIRRALVLTFACVLAACSLGGSGLPGPPNELVAADADGKQATTEIAKQQAALAKEALREFRLIEQQVTLAGESLQKIGLAASTTMLRSR